MTPSIWGVRAIRGKGLVQPRPCTSSLSWSTIACAGTADWGGFLWIKWEENPPIMGDCMWENGNILIICSLSIVNENISNICPFYLPRYTPKLGDWDPNLNQLEIFCMDNFGGFNHQEWKFVGIMGIWKISEKMAWRSVFVTTKYVDIQKHSANIMMFEDTEKIYLSKWRVSR